MKKSLIIFCVVIMCLLSFSIFITAHSGRTDSHGGHRDNSTGEYHYHHGYSAHQHYDMDGDGIIDCPYEYKDKTNHSNTPNNNYTSAVNKDEDTSEHLFEVSFGDILIIILQIIWKSLVLLIVGIIVWVLVYAALTLLLSWICEKLLKIAANSSIISIISIIIIVVVVIIISSIIVLSTEGLL